MTRIIFKDYPNFRPNLTPREIFKLGSFGGTYWRPIYSHITKKNYVNKHKKYPESWFHNIPSNHMTSSYDNYDKTINKYGVKVGTTLRFWEESGWISKYHPYGWVQWYCDFFMGKRCEDDERQIKRWENIAGPNGRFKKQLIAMIKQKRKKYNSYEVSPRIRQTLQHWAYKLTESDMKNK
jgi:hypothetical protein